MESSFFTKINYSSCNEDSDSELKALALKETDHVLCITGSGARALDLLSAKPASIHSVDFNPSQTHLLELKIRAYQELSYVEFSRFIGLQPSGNRKSVYVRLRIGLPIQAQHYWDGHIARIEKGLLYCGTWENLLRGMAKATVFRRKLLQALMNAQSLEEQAEMWNREWENHTWRLFLKVLCNQFLWTHIIREPGARLIPKMFEVNRYMHDRLHHLANKHLLSKNAFAHLLFYGEYREGCLLPHHLREELFDTIKSRVHTIVPVTNSLINEIKNQSSKEIFTAYSLSDFSSYAEEGIYKSIWDELVRNSETGARFCERQFLVKRSPELLTHHIQRNTALERDLESIDLCAIYTFCAGTISSSES